MMKGVINMTRKHYILIANAIKENILYKPNNKEYKPIDVDLKGLINSLSYVFKCDNNNFDNQRFKDHINDGNL